MSKINFAADGSIIKNNRVIESMADSKPLDYFNLAGNLKLAGSIRATDFIKEDGTSLPSVTVNKLALPENVYYVNKKLGINQENPLADFDVKGTARVQGELGVEGSMGVSGNVVGKGSAAFGGKIIAEDELAVGKAAVFGGSVLSRGKVVAEDELAVGKAAVFGGSVLSRGKVVAEDELAVGKAAVFGQKISAIGDVIIGGSDGSARLAVKGTTHEHGTAWFSSDKGPNVSNVHWGGNGDWYIRSAKPEGGVIIQDSAPNGNTNIGSNLNLKGGVSIHNPDKWGTHFPWNGDQKNYIRGDTEIRGDTNQMGVLNVATNVGIDKNFKYTPDGNQLTIGKTDESNLRLGRHPDYSWIQSHGSKPLRINPLGNQVCINNTCLTESALKSLANAPASGNGTVFMIGYRNDGNVSKASMNYDSISDDMNMLTILPAINTTAQSKAAVYFNIKLKDGAQPGKFTVVSDDGILFEYSTEESPYLNTPSDWTGIPGSLSANVVGDYRGWKGQGATPYDYTIPNTSSTGIVKCKLAWYQGGGGVAFQIKGLKTAIWALGALA